MPAVCCVFPPCINWPRGFSARPREELQLQLRGAGSHACSPSANAVICLPARVPGCIRARVSVALHRHVRVFDLASCSATLANKQALYLFIFALFALGGAGPFSVCAAACGLLRQIEAAYNAEPRGRIEPCCRGLLLSPSDAPATPSLLRSPS